MIPQSVLLYEIDINEIRDLPYGYQVLRYDALYKTCKLMQAGIDRFRQEGKRYVYLLFEAPPCPKLSPSLKEAVTS